MRRSASGRWNFHRPIGCWCSRASSCRRNSPIKSVKDFIDRKELRISGGKGDSVTLYLARNLKEAKLVETDNTPADARQKLRRASKSIRLSAPTGNA